MPRKSILEYTRKEKGGAVLTVKSISLSQNINGIDTCKKLDSDDVVRVWYINEIKKILELNDNDLPINIIDDIFSYSEFDSVFAALSSLKDWLTSLDKKPKKNNERLPKAFIKKRDDLIEALRENNQYSLINELEKISYKQKLYYEDELYNSKQILYSQLINECSCSELRAKNIIKILEEL